MIRSDGKQSFRKSNQTLHSTKPQAKKQISPLRQRMISDMELAGYHGGVSEAELRIPLLVAHPRARTAENS